MRRALGVLVAIWVVGLFCCTPSKADSMTFNFSGTDTDGPISGKATVTTGAGTVTVTITDLQGNIVSIGQSVSDFSFTLSGGDASTAVLTSMSGNSITVNSGGTVTSNGTTNAGWATGDNSGTTINLAAAGKGHFDNLSNFEILGPTCAGGTYCDANGSIDGNPAHNSLFNGTVTFDLSVSGVTAGTGITGASMSFGTGPEAILSSPGGPPIPTPTPEPGSLALLGIGFLSMAGVLRRRSVKS